MLRPFIPYALFAVVGLFAFLVLYPCPNGSPENARRSACQSNLKQISLAIRQYTQDYDDHLPSRHWVSSLTPYMHILPPDGSFFQCPSTDQNPETSDYFFNASYLNGRLATVEDPTHLILLGDGTNDAPPNITLTHFPTAWRHDENSAVMRHLETANYGFADGHIKALKASGVTNDFLMVTP